MATQLSKQLNVNTTKSESLPSLKKTIHRNNSQKNYAKLDNETLRAHIEGDPITAKDIWLDALTCREDWLFTTPNIAARHEIHHKKAQRLITRLVKSGLAERCKITDPTTGKIILHHYVFYERPVDKKCPVDKTTKPTEKIAKKPKKPVDKNCPVVPIKKHYKEAASAPPPLLPPKKDLSPAIKTELIDSGITDESAVSCQEKFGDEYTLEAIRLSKAKEIPARYFDFLAAEKRGSVTARVTVARKEAERIQKERGVLARALAEQKEAQKMAQTMVTDFAAGARMMREALRSKKGHR